MIKIEENYALLPHNTLGIDVKSRWFISYDSEEDLHKILSDEYFYSLPFLHVGEGSNLLFLSDYNGIILHSNIKGIEITNEDDQSVTLQVGAGWSWDSFVQYAISHRWGGVENLSGIPGEVGAAAVQNIGAYGSEVKDLIVSVEAYDIQTGEKHIILNQECEYAYRKSKFKAEWKGRYIITSVLFRLSKHPQYNVEYGNLKTILSGKEITLQTIREAVISVRDSKLPNPKVLGNAGSFFMNPYIENAQYETLKQTYPDIPAFPVSEKLVKIPAAWLIDQCGLKGFQQGKAAVHENQPLVLVNKGGATGQEIADLAQYIEKAVQEKFGITIIPEVTYI